MSIGFKGQLWAFVSLVKLELRCLFKSIPFVVVLLTWLFVVFSNLSSTVLYGGEYGVSMHPLTSELMGLIINPLLMFGLVLIVFYSAEIVWREQSLKFNLIIDASPIRNSSLFLSKLTTLILLPVILLSTGILTCVVCQIALGYSDFKFGLYFSLFYYSGFKLFFLCMVSLFINSISKTKFMGMGLVAITFALILKSDVLGFQHPLVSPGFLPQIFYSDMNGFYGGLSKFQHLSLYWLLFGLF